MIYTIDAKASVITSRRQPINLHLNIYLNSREHLITATRSWKKKRERERGVAHSVNVYRPRKFWWISMNAAATASQSNRVVLLFSIPHQPTFSSRCKKPAPIDIDPSPSISTRSYRNTARVTTYLRNIYIFYLLLEISSTQLDKFNAKSCLLPREQRMD